jgi:uncharacterized protein (DUF2126 family)
MTESHEDRILAALIEQDDRLAARDLGIWMGAEPTFTDRFSMDPQWHNLALGTDKELRGRGLAAALAAEPPGCALLRSLGRLYPGEQDRRWSYGLLSRRDGVPLWTGPPDPLLGGTGSDAASLEGFAPALLERLPALGWSGTAIAGTVPHEHRLILSPEGRPLVPSLRSDPRLQRPSAHARNAGAGAVLDDLAAEGWYLLIITSAQDQGRQFASLELPGVGNQDGLITLLGLVGPAASEAGLGGVILRGQPPAAGPRLHWTTITPDPGVVEINQAPAATLAEHLTETRRQFAAAEAQGLSPYRLQYNGQVEDSGGGGQISIGGPVPEQSPFFTHPHLLPALLRYLNHHPALSYWFAPHYVGAFSQAPRPDEGVADLFGELAVALDALSRGAAATPELLWRSLNPFLRDVSGNAHRSELNIEKLWSPFPRPDGVAGVVELRAFRMAGDPDTQAALAALIRSLIAMLMVHPFDRPLIEWGARLHDRFALPFFIGRDLHSVLMDLERKGFGLAGCLTRRLRDQFSRELVTVACGNELLTLSSALEFWPQVGDTMTQPADSRLVDASTGRMEVRLAGGSAGDLLDWRLIVEGCDLPMRAERGEEGPVRVVGLRYRRYDFSQGLHPTIEPRLPIRIQLFNRRTAQLLTLDYHEWRPDGRPYPGLPADLEEAAERRRERIVVRQSPQAAPPKGRPPPPQALSDYCLDLRRI